MYRRGPTKTTSASVQCQKCLKRARHYSYECKASTQERPYVSRPSRTQQLLNPKLAPKLASDASDTLQKKKGVADEELAKIEAERARKRELEQDDSDGASPKRARSSSHDSVSSISTSRSLSPPPQAQQSSAALPDGPGRSRKGPLPGSHASRKQSFSSASDYERRHSPSPSPPAQARDDHKSSSLSRGSISPHRDISPVRSRRGARDEPADQGSAYNRRRRHSSSPSRSPPRRERRHFRSRSRDQPRKQRHDKHVDEGSAPTRGGNRGRGDAPPRRTERRDRSLSPFSKRLALTQSMNTGR